MKKLREYERAKFKEIRKVMFDCAPLMMAFSAIIYPVINS
jgi:hypothetical protein